MSEAQANEQPKKKKQGPGILYILILVLLAIVFLVSAGMLVKYFIESRQSQQTYNELKDIRGDYTRPTRGGQSAAEPSGEATVPTTSPYVTITDPETGMEMQILRQFKDLYLLNPDLVGWISIPGTNVDYPVVQRPESTDYYLYRDFYGKYDSHGCIYAREVCDFSAPSDNVTLYGHRMKDNTMFADLAKYQDINFWRDNQYIYVDTLTEYHTYQIICVFTTTASVGEGFTYHQFVNAANEGEFNQFIANCNRHRVFDTGLTASYGDKLITLSTCEYTHENGRLVVVAKRID